MPRKVRRIEKEVREEEDGKAMVEIEEESFCGTQNAVGSLAEGKGVGSRWPEGGGGTETLKCGRHRLCVAVAVCVCVGGGCAQ